MSFDERRDERNERGDTTKEKEPLVTTMTYIEGF